MPGIGEATARGPSAPPSSSSGRRGTRCSSGSSSTRPNAGHTRLLQALAVWGAVRHAAEAYEADAGRLAGELAAQRPIAAPAGGGRLRRLFMAGRRQGRADDAARRVRAMLDTGRGQRPARAAAQEAARSRHPARHRCGATSSALGGLLRAARPGRRLGGDVAAAEGFLPADIVERVNASGWTRPGSSDSLRLRGYQSFGARFALVQRRVILGDEMGLGKTVQAIAAMAHLAAPAAPPTSWSSARPAC